tara:strand:+ start:1022 stop:1519 length:498 start_codon:yes stop_codon:yes gene_type:complete
MKNLNCILSLLLLSIFFGCNSEEDTSTSQENKQRNGILIFGWFSDSSCEGVCSDMYKLENGKIYKDIDNTYPENTFLEGNFQLINNADYEDFESLILELPKEIFNEPNGYLDCSDCTNDNGGFYLEFKSEDGLKNSWRFRNALFPNYIENYRSLLLDKLAELNSL